MQVRSLIFLALLPLLLPAKDKLKPEEVVAQHLNSIGTPEARAAAKSRTATGKTHMRILTGGQGQADGRAFLFSEGQHCRVALPFDFADYWGEHFVFDLNRTDVGFSQPTVRSGWGNFIRNYDSILKEGLVTGALSTAWALLDAAGRQAKLDYDGIKKVEGKEFHQISYRGKKGQGDMKVLLFFETDTFRHVRTTYDMVVSAGLGASPEESSRQSERRFELEENFGGFKTFDGLTLPTQWTVRYTSGNSNRPMREWSMSFDQVLHNQPIDPKVWLIDQTVK